MLAWLLEREEGVVVDVVDHRGIRSGLGVYLRGEGEETVKTSKQMHDKTISGARGVLTQCYTIPTKEKTSGEVFPKFSIFGQMKRRGMVAGLLC